MIRLSDEARRLLALFEKETDATVRDCIVDDDHDRVVYLVAAGEMGQAIGAGGENVKRVEERLDREVKLVEDAATPEDFVAGSCITQRNTFTAKQSMSPLNGTPARFSVRTNP